MARKATPAYLVVEHYDQVRGSRVFKTQDSKSRGPAFTHARSILAAGYTVEEVQGCIDWLDEDEWAKDRIWSLAYVGKKMADYRRMRAKAEEDERRAKARFGKMAT